MRVMIAAKEGTEILVDILNQSFSVGKIREICGQDEFVMPNGYTDFSRYAGLHKNDRIGEGKYADMTYGDFLLKLGSFTGKGGYLDKLIRNSMKPFTEGDDPGKRQGLFNRLYPGLMKYFRKDFDKLFKNFDLKNPSMDTHYTTMLMDVAVGMDAIFGNHGRYLRDMNSAVNRFASGTLTLEQFRSELNAIQDSMAGSGESNGTAVEKSAAETWKRLESSCRMSVPGVDPKYTWYKIENYDDIWPVATKPVTDWCVAQKGGEGSSGHRYFNKYGAPYYMLCEGHRPVFLLHVNSHQFKDAEDYPVKLDRPSQLKFVESGMKLLDKLDYSGDYRGDFRVFQEYLDDVDGLRKDYDDDLEDTISPDAMEDTISPDAMAALSDDEFARRLDDWKFVEQVNDYWKNNGPDSILSLLGKSKLEMLAGRNFELDVKLLESRNLDDDLVLKILSEESKRGIDMRMMLRLAIRNVSSSCALKILERFPHQELILFYSSLCSRLDLSNDDAEKFARMILGCEGKIGRQKMLSSISSLNNSQIIISMLRSSNDGEVIDMASRRGAMRWIKEGEFDDVLWNVVMNGGRESHGNLLEACPEKLSEEMSDHLLRRYSKDMDMIEKVIMRVSLSRGMVESLVSLGDKSMDRLLLQGQVLDDDLVLRLIDGLGDDYKGELRCKKNRNVHKYGPEVVDVALEAAMRNDREGPIVETQDLSEENIRKVMKKGDRKDMELAMDRNRLPKDMIEELLSSGDRDSVLCRHQSLDDGQIDELVRRYGDEAVEWIAGNDLISSRHAYELIASNLDSYGVLSNLLKRKSIDWKRVLPVLLNGRVKISRHYDKFLLRAVKDCHDDDILLSIATLLDGKTLRSDTSNFWEIKIIDEILGKNLSKKLLMDLLRCPSGDQFAYCMVINNMNLNLDNLHYIAEHFGKASKFLAEDRLSSIPLDDETVELLRRWNDGEINFQLLKHGYLDKDMDADEVGELVGGYGDRVFSSNLFQVRDLGDGFIEHAVKNKDMKFALDLCKNRYLNKSQVLRLLAMDSKDREMRNTVAENNGDEEVIRMFKGTDDPDMIKILLMNNHADKSVLKEVCCGYRGEMTMDLANMMYAVLGMISSIENSDFLFDVMKEHSDDFRDERELVRLYGIGDDDVKWLCKKLCWENLGKRLPVPKSRTARIAGRICRRIMRMRRIAERISR